MMSSVEARVCTVDALHLCLRIQSWVLFGTRVRKSVLQTIKRFDICSHFMDHSDLAEFGFRSVVESELYAYYTGSQKADGLKCRCCKRCRHDYQLQFQAFEGDGLALVVTRWLDLGPGKRQTLERSWNLKARSPIRTEFETFSHPSKMRKGCHWRLSLFETNLI